MAAPKIEAKHVARAAAEGVAIALAARADPEFRAPFHIIVGIPPDIFRVSLEPGEGGEVNVGRIDPTRELA